MTGVQTCALPISKTNPRGTRIRRATLCHVVFMPVHSQLNLILSGILSNTQQLQRSLDDLIKSSGALEPGRSVGIITQVLSALGFAHASGIVHRDIKPSNIMILQNGDVKVADFGIARIDASEFTLVGDLLGTPAYMAPEQLSGAPVDHRTDLFAAGVILFEMLTGVKPFRGKSITEIMSFMETRGP